MKLFYLNCSCDLRKRAKALNALFSVGDFILVEGIAVFSNEMELIFSPCEKFSENFFSKPGQLLQPSYHILYSVIQTS